MRDVGQSKTECMNEREDGGMVRMLRGGKGW